MQRIINWGKFRIMAIKHRIDSILGINKKREAEMARTIALGKQLAKLTVENAEKDKIIENLGTQTTHNMLENMKLKRELESLKKGIN